MIGWQALKAMHEGAIVELGSDRYRFVHQIVVDGGPDHLTQWWNGHAWQGSDGLLEAQLWSSEWEVVEPSYPVGAAYWERRYIAQYKVTKQACDERAAQEVEYRATIDRLTRELAEATEASCKHRWCSALNLRLVCIYDARGNCVACGGKRP